MRRGEGGYSERTVGYSEDTVGTVRVQWIQ